MTVVVVVVVSCLVVVVAVVVVVCCRRRRRRRRRTTSAVEAADAGERLEMRPGRRSTGTSASSSHGRIDGNVRMSFRQPKFTDDYDDIG